MQTVLAGIAAGHAAHIYCSITEDPSLCPLLCLQQYEETTKELRPKDGSQQLLIATVPLTNQ